MPLYVLTIGLVHATFNVFEHSGFSLPPVLKSSMNKRSGSSIDKKALVKAFIEQQTSQHNSREPSE